MRRQLVILYALAVGVPATAQAEFAPIEDRAYAIDLYRGPVIGSPRIVGMGGAAVAGR